MGALSAAGAQALRSGEAATPPPPVQQVVVPEDTLSRARALRDEAEALTPTEVWLDESARERWLPLAAELERALERPETPTPLRRELEATLTALDDAGVR